MQKDDFEIFMRNPDSQSTRALRFFKNDGNTAKYDPESLIPSNYDEQLILKKQEEDKLKGSSV